MRDPTEGEVWIVRHIEDTLYDIESRPYLPKQKSLRKVVGDALRHAYSIGGGELIHPEEPPDA